MIRYTVRAMAWAPLAIAATIATAIVIGLGLLGRPLPADSVVLLGGAFAAAVALSLDDPAHALVAAMPVGPRRRVLLRAGLAGGVAATAWLLLTGIERWLGDAPLAAPGIRGVIALAAVGVAVTVAMARRSPDLAASVGAAVAFGWALSTNIVPNGALLGLSTAWIAHTSAVTGLGAIGVIVATRR